jgi:hypothetical protein
MGDRNGRNDYGFARKGKSSRPRPESSLGAYADKLRAEADRQREQFLTDYESGILHQSGTGSGELNYQNASGSPAISLGAAHFSREQRETLHGRFFSNGIRAREANLRQYFEKGKGNYGLSRENRSEGGSTKPSLGEKADQLRAEYDRQLEQFLTDYEARRILNQSGSGSGELSYQNVGGSPAISLGATHFSREQ